MLGCYPFLRSRRLIEKNWFLASLNWEVEGACTFVLATALQIPSKCHLKLQICDHLINLGRAELHNQLSKTF